MILGPVAPQRDIDQIAESAKRDIDQIAEFVNSSVRSTPPPGAAAGPRQGSLPGIKGRRGFNDWLYSHWGNRGNAVYTGIGGLLIMLLSGGVAWAVDEPLLFPSLGASAFLFFETPMALVASPRNTVIGHYVGGAVAFFWLYVFDLLDQPTAIEVGFTDGRWAAVALSLAFTGLILRLLRAAHPPAGATTVIVALGLLDTPEQMAVLALGVLLVAIPAGIINRLCGVPSPLWVKPYPGLRALLRPGSVPPQQAAAPFVGGLLDGWSSAPPGQGGVASRQ